MCLRNTALWRLLFSFAPKSLCFVREVSIMLPCQGTCPNYQPGCHKCCAEWKMLQDRQRVQRQQKKPIWTTITTFASP